MKVNVVTPLSRHENFHDLEALMVNQGVSQWHLLTRPPELVVCDNPMIETHNISTPDGDIGLLLVNQFVKHYQFKDDERYCFLMDDDWYPPGFIDEVAKHDDPLLVCSMKRGDHQPDGAKHPCWGLLAYPDNLCYGHVGFEQGMFTGEVLNSLKETVNPNGHSEDLIIEAYQKWSTKFLPHLFVWFNWFEKGRWDK